MTEHILEVFVLCTIWFLVGLRVGYVTGFKRGQKKIDLNALPATEAFAFYQARERFRHLQDIHGIDKDLRRMKALGVVPPDIPVDVWVNVKGGNDRG